MSPLLMTIIFLRVLSGTMEIIAAFFIYRLNSIESALKINALLASIGPVIFLGAMYLGLTGLARDIPWRKLVLVYTGVALIFVGLRL